MSACRVEGEVFFDKSTLLHWKTPPTPPRQHDPASLKRGRCPLPLQCTCLEGQEGLNWALATGLNLFSVTHCVKKALCFNCCVFKWAVWRDSSPYTGILCQNWYRMLKSFSPCLVLPSVIGYGLKRRGGRLFRRSWSSIIPSPPWVTGMGVIPLSSLSATKKRLAKEKASNQTGGKQIWGDPSLGK